MIRRLKLRIWLVLALATALPGIAEASAVCDRLHQRLADLPKTVGSTGNTRIYSNAISRQTIQLRKVQSDMRRLGCSSGSIVVYGNANADACDMLGETAGRMRDNLATLDSKRLDAATTAGDLVQRRRLQAALQANGCEDESREVLEASVGEKKVHRNILRDLPPAGQGVPMLREATGVTGYSLEGSPMHGNLRTLCVRTCDGAFFPISANASPMNFARDAEMCAMRCPGTQTELYYHALETQETDRMVSAATGQPYSLLPNAFAYRTRDLARPGSCGCNVSALEKNRSLPALPDRARTQTGSITEITTQPPAESKVQAEVKVEVEERPYDPNARVRIIGPTYLPREETAIDLKNPAVR